MNMALKIILLGKIKEFIRKRILEEEIIKGSKKGLEKLEAVMDNFWENIRKFIEKSKKVDNKYIPDSIEFATEELILETIEVIKNEINIKKFIEEILGEEKIEIGI